jgi:hypothetical protein
VNQVLDVEMRIMGAWIGTVRDFWTMGNFEAMGTWDFGIELMAWPNRIGHGELAGIVVKLREGGRNNA